MTHYKSELAIGSKFVLHFKEPVTVTVTDVSFVINTKGDLLRVEYEGVFVTKDGGTTTNIYKQEEISKSRVTHPDNVKYNIGDLFTGKAETGGYRVFVVENIMFINGDAEQVIYRGAYTMGAKPPITTNMRPSDLTKLTKVNGITARSV